MANLIDKLKEKWKELVMAFAMVFCIVATIILGGFTPVIVPDIPPTGAISTFQVARSIDDVHQVEISGDWQVDWVQVYLYANPTESLRKHGGIMWQPTIPQGSIINSAIIGHYFYSQDDPNCVIYGHDVDNATTFGTGQNLTDRTRTTASVSWVENDLGIGWHNVTVTDIVQEIVNRDGWQSGNNMSMLYIVNTDLSKRCYIRSYDGNATRAAKLYVSATSVELNSPSSETTKTTNQVNFNFTPYIAEETIQNASLHITNTTSIPTGISWETHHWNTTTVQNEVENTIGFSFSYEGSYKWNIQVFVSTMSYWAPSNYTLICDTPPRYQNIGSNSSWIYPNDTVLVYGQGFDGIGLHQAWISTNETGVFKNYTYPYTTASLAVDDLTNLFNFLYSNRIAGTYLNNLSASGIYLDYLSTVGLQLYLRTKNSSYLTIAYNAAQEAYDNRDGTTGMLRVANSGGTWITGYQKNTKTILDTIGALAELNTTFRTYYYHLIDALDDYAYNTTNHLVYLNLKSDGTKTDDYGRINIFGAVDLALMYYQCYRLMGGGWLTWGARFLEAYWKQRNTTTCLMTHMVDVDSNASLYDYMKLNCAGDWLQALSTFVKSGNGVIGPINLTDMLVQSTDAYYQYFWNSEENWFMYRLHLDGTVIASFAVMGFPAFDRGMLMASIALNNQTFMDRPKDDMINSYNELKCSSMDGLLEHSEGSYDFWFCSNINYIVTCFMYYCKYNNQTLLDNANLLMKYGLPYMRDSNELFLLRYGFEGIVTNFRFLVEGYQFKNNETSLDYLPHGGFYSAYYSDPVHRNYMTETPYLNDTADSWVWSNFTWQNINVEGVVIQWKLYYSDTYGNINVTSTHQFTVGESYTELTVGWNNFTAWSVDVGHTLGEVNASLNSEGIDWSQIVLKYTNNSEYIFIYDWGGDVNVEVTSMADRFYILVNVEDTWSHNYGGS